MTRTRNEVHFERWFKLLRDAAYFVQFSTVARSVREVFHCRYKKYGCGMETIDQRKLQQTWFAMLPALTRSSAYEVYGSTAICELTIILWII